jgi:hypothetical protein
MIATTFVFAMQDGISRYLAGEYNVLMVVMIRYWFFAAFVIALAARSRGGIARAARTDQALAAGRARGAAGVGDLRDGAGLHASGPRGKPRGLHLLPASDRGAVGPDPRRRVGWRRWAAIGVGFVGVLVILQPGFRVFEVEALMPLTSAFMFALYGLLTRYAARKDSAETSFFWTGTVGAVVMTIIGVWSGSRWRRVTGSGWRASASPGRGDTGC